MKNLKESSKNAIRWYFVSQSTHAACCGCEECEEMFSHINEICENPPVQFLRSYITERNTAIEEYARAVDVEGADAFEHEQAFSVLCSKGF